MSRLGIDIELSSNLPWIYIHSINKKRVKERFKAEHGFTIAFYPVRKNQELEFTDIKEIIKLIRKYKNENRE